jgi:hypothetical protein
VMLELVFLHNQRIFSYGILYSSTIIIELFNEVLIVEIDSLIADIFKFKVKVAKHSPSFAGHCTCLAIRRRKINVD